MLRKGFTLVEMLVATMLFMTGFVAVYSLFIAGVNYRHDADQLTDLSLASTSLISTFRLTMRDAWKDADEFLGDGDHNTTDSGKFYKYPDNPGIQYRIQTAMDITGNEGTGSDTSAGLRIILYLINAGPGASELSFTELHARQRVDPANPEDLEYLTSKYPNSLPSDDLPDYNALATYEDRANFILIRRNIIYKSEAIILRR
ncbi:MAG: prepilin-type N-terminal cleavage/methylation domain-containing protein [Planctomycetes bacterium]|nr:prepilin-type N-terminal cleavage/methylation domain-containing protein [Planctomycetota bacterium]